MPTIFPEEREIIKENLKENSNISPELKKEISILYQLGIDENEIRYLISIKKNMLRTRH